MLCLGSPNLNRTFVTVASKGRREHQGRAANIKVANIKVRVAISRRDLRRLDSSPLKDYASCGWSTPKEAQFHKTNVQRQGVSR
jgi:hypothetical protein